MSQSIQTYGNPADSVLDYQLTPEGLDDKYNPDGDGEHPVVTRKMWREAVYSEDTISGYWDYVAHKLKEAAENPF